MGWATSTRNWRDVDDLDRVLGRKDDKDVRATKTVLAKCLEQPLINLGFAKSLQSADNRTIKQISNNYTMVQGDDFLLVDSSAINITIIVPPVGSLWDSDENIATFFTVKKADTNSSTTITLVPTGAELFNLSATFVLSGASSPAVNIINDGVNFWSF